MILERFREALWYAKKAAYTALGLTDTEIYYRKFPLLRELFGYGLSTHTGRAVSEATALNCSTVWACIRVISETLASLPLHLMQQKPTGKFPAVDHPLFAVLHDEPNPDMTAMELREVLVAHALSYGNGYALRVTQGNSPDGSTLRLYPLDPKTIRPVRNAPTGQLEYEWRDGSKTAEILPAWRVLHIRGLGFDGLQGYPVITMARQSIALALIQEEYAEKFFARGGRRPYILERPTDFKTQQDRDKFRENWEQFHSVPDGFHRPPILYGGLKYQELGFTLQDAQFLQGRQFSVPEICRWFLLTPHKVQDLTHATYSNTENLAIEFWNGTILPWCVRVEQAIRRCLLTKEEKKQGYYAKHNNEGVLRGDFASRMSGFATMLQNGIRNIDEIRDLDDVNPLPDGAGKAYHIQMNMQTVPGTGEPTSIEKAALAKAVAPKATVQQ